MKVPTFEYNKVIKDNGEFSDGYRQMFTQLLNQLTINFSDYGLVPPSQPTATITDLTSAANGTLIYDSTTNQLKVNINGTFHVVQVI